MYGYANGDPINNSDPFGLCAQGADSVLVTVTVDCNDRTTSKKQVWAKQATAAEMAEVQSAANRLTGGNATYTPADVALGYAQVIATGGIYSIPTTVGGYTVLEGALTQTGGGQPAFVAFRSDALAGIVSGNLGLKVGNLGMNVATIVGHEGAHLWQSKHPGTYAIKWGFVP